MFVLTLTDDKLLKFVLILGKSCVAFVWGEKLGWPRTLFIILLAKTRCSVGGFSALLRVWKCSTPFADHLGEKDIHFREV